jgi:hypothetical protein
LNSDFLGRIRKHNLSKYSTSSSRPEGCKGASTKLERDRQRERERERKRDRERERERERETS